MQLGVFFKGILCTSTDFGRDTRIVQKSPTSRRKKKEAASANQRFLSWPDLATKRAGLWSCGPSILICVSSLIELPQSTSSMCEIQTVGKQAQDAITSQLCDNRHVFTPSPPLHVSAQLSHRESVLPTSSATHTFSPTLASERSVTRKCFSEIKHC